MASLTFEGVPYPESLGKWNTDTWRRSRQIVFCTKRFLCAYKVYQNILKHHPLSENGDIPPETLLTPWQSKNAFNDFLKKARVDLIQHYAANHIDVPSRISEKHFTPKDLRLGFTTIAVTLKIPEIQIRRITRNRSLEVWKRYYNAKNDHDLSAAVSHLLSHFGGKFASGRPTSTATTSSSTTPTAPCERTINFRG